MVEKIRLLASYFIMLFKLILGNKKNRYLLLNSPEHGNLGDHAISLAEIQLLEEHNINYIELSGRFCRSFFNLLKRNVNEMDVICITGGGFLGSLWQNEDLFIQKIIASFPYNKIIIFPQTLYFGDDDRYIAGFRKVYEQHGNIIFFHREAKSLNIADELFGNTSIQNVLMPDMALFYNWRCRGRQINKSKRILVCFRNDKEGVANIDWRKNAFDYFLNSGYEVEEFSTVKNHAISFFSREKELNSLLCKIARASLVITDRLHGMLLSVIAGTPCICMDNISGKVGNVWSAWLHEIEYVKFLGDGVDFSVHLLDELLRMNIQDYDLDVADGYVDIMLAYLQGRKGKDDESRSFG